MSNISVRFKSPYDGFYKTFGSAFVSFTTQPDLVSDWLETAMKAHPACQSMEAFDYDKASGKGHFILPDTSLNPCGRADIRYPVLRTITQRTVYRWQDQIRDVTYTHIATGAHGFESLCCSELGAEIVEEAEPPAGGKVTCPLCKCIWGDCKAVTAADFQITE